MTIFRHIRTQRPVGQGFFHTAILDFAGSTVRYVYDCGSDDIKPLKRAIKQYLSRPEIYGIPPAKDDKIDLFFVSHFHADHVNGAMELVQQSKVSTVVLPYLSPAMRIQWVLQAIEDDKATEAYLTHMRDPVAWYDSHGVHMVISVHHSPEGSREGASPEEGGPVPFNPEIHGKEVSLDIKSLRDAERAQPHDEPDRLGVASVHISDTTPLQFSGNGKIVDWGLLTFVPPIKNAAQDILKTLGNLAHFNDDADAEAKMLDPQYVLLKAADDGWRNDILKAYKSVIGSKANRASLCLYSGPLMYRPAASDTHYYYNYVHNRRDSIWSSHHQNRVGWLGTGDAELGHAPHLSAFKTHYSAILSNLRTMTLPHHGAYRDFDPELARMAINFVASAGADSKYGHPDIAVVQCVLENNRGFFHVDEKASSFFIEIVKIR